jgi:hypothetical protein
VALAGGMAGIAMIALLWAVLGVFLGIAYNAFVWVTGL